MMSSCPKPKRERGYTWCYVCGAAAHQKQFCPRRKIAGQPQPVSSVEGRMTRLVEMNHTSILSYMVRVNLDIGDMIAVFDTGSPISLLDEAQILTDTLIDLYLGNSKFEGINQSSINILG